MNQTSPYLMCPYCKDAMTDGGEFNLFLCRSDGPNIFEVYAVCCRCEQTSFLEPDDKEMHGGKLRMIQ